MSTASNGNSVKVHYTGKRPDGSIFDSSAGREPLAFTLGQGSMIPGFENGVLGMAVGDKKSVTFPAAEGYGERREELVLNVPKSQVPEDIKPEVGMTLNMTQPNGQPVPVKVTEVTDEGITLDANHELAGLDLTFELELVEIA